MKQRRPAVVKVWKTRQSVKFHSKFRFNTKKEKEKTNQQNEGSVLAGCCIRVITTLDFCDTDKISVISRSMTHKPVYVFGA